MHKQKKKEDKIDALNKMKQIHDWTQRLLSTLPTLIIEMKN
jgi:hypothetical protein